MQFDNLPDMCLTCEKNMIKLANFSKNRKSIKVHTHVTLSLLNLHDLPNVLKWCEHQYNTWGYEDQWGVHGYQNLLPHFNFVEWPRHLNICNLPLIYAISSPGEYENPLSSLPPEKD